MEDKEYESIIPTAILTAYPRTLTDIPYAKEMFDELKKKAISVDLMLDKLAPEIEARYKLIDKLLKGTSITQILELASGYSTRGLDFTLNKNATYVELELKEVVDKKKRFINKIMQTPNDLHIIQGNALNYNDFTKCITFFKKEQEVAVIDEGLLRYLDFEEKRIVAENVYKLLSQYGGVWITCDVTPKNFIINQDKNMPNLNKNITDISVRNNANWRFEDEDHVKKFFTEIGFSVEFHYFHEIKNKLTSPQKLNLPSSEVDKLIDMGIVVVMRI